MGGYTRRRLLSSAAGAIALGATAGCLGGASEAESPDQTIARASFFVFGDFAARVAGEVAAAETLVPVGQHGHGWEPGPKVRAEIHGADVLYHGPPGFQPWVDDIVRDLREDGADVAPADVSAGVELLAAGSDHDHDEGGDGETAHGDDHGETHDEDGDHDGNHTGEHDAEGGEESHDRKADVDPHFWMDPLRAKEAVAAARDGLTEVDPENADAYAGNAEDYRNRLDDLHDRIETVLAEASRDVVLLSGHDAFRYFRDRYGVEVVALSDASPDDQPTPRDVRRAQETIEAHDLRYVCADPLESQTAAEQLVEETDAEEVLPLSAMPGLKAEWAEEGWGYVEIMENVNLPALERALDA